MDYFRIRDGNLEIEKKHVVYENESPIFGYMIVLISRKNQVHEWPNYIYNHERGDPLIFRKILST